MSELKLSLILLSAPFVALYALAQLSADYALYRHVRDFGQPATAVVDSIAPASFLGLASTSHVVSYSLHLPGRALVRGAAHVRPDEAAAYRAGEPIAVVYVSEMASHTALSVDHAWRALVSDLVAAAAYAAVLAVTFLLWRAAPKRHPRALQLPLRLSR